MQWSVTFLSDVNNSKGYKVLKLLFKKSTGQITTTKYKILLPICCSHGNNEKKKKTELFFGPSDSSSYEIIQLWELRVI